MIAQSPHSLTNRLELEKIFGRKAPLHVDLGCGDGSFLCALAQRLPDKNFLGIERLSGRVQSSARKAARLDNVRLLLMESSYAVRYLLPAESVETFYLLFPDPWPKRRHQRRRIVTADFLNSVHEALEQNGVIYIATDHVDYFRAVEQVARNHPGFAKVDFADCAFMPEPQRGQVNLPLTKFEQKFREQSALIYRLELRKVTEYVEKLDNRPGG